jgi:hypothetical protein
MFLFDQDLIYTEFYKKDFYFRIFIIIITIGISTNIPNIRNII